MKTRPTIFSYHANFTRAVRSLLPFRSIHMINYKNVVNIFFYLKPLLCFNLQDKFNSRIMAKVSTLCTLILLLVSFSHVVARPDRSFLDVTPMEHRQDSEMQRKLDRDSCVGLAEDECLMRKTLEAHLDYIYTQKQNNN